MHLRVGRLVLRRYKPRLMWLPSGYKAPRTIYLVELEDPASIAYQFGAFTRRADAEECLLQLATEGHADLILNMVPVHQRLEDWHWDR